MTKRMNEIAEEVDDAIRTFNHRYMEYMETGQPEISYREYAHLRWTSLALLLDYWAGAHIRKITKEKADVLKMQLRSPDRENWLIAFLMIQQIHYQGYKYSYRNTKQHEQNKR